MVAKTSGDGGNEAEISDVDPAGLEVGGRIELPHDSELVICGVTPADDAPEADESGPLYEAIQRSSSHEGTTLYRPHHIRVAIESGAEYAGREDVETETEPFWCEGCGQPFMGSERYDPILVDAVVCSYGCKEDVAAERRADRWSHDEEAI